MNKVSRKPLNRFVGLWLFIFLLLPVGYSIAQEQEVSEAELAQTLAPIALYPDSLLTHVLIASTYPLEVIEAHRWRDEQEGDELDLSTIEETKRWEPSVIALLSFPTVLERMHDELDWTQQLGEAFLADEARVLASIQVLRQQADQAGSFDEMDNVNIVREEKVIIIEPQEPEIIYVPYYDTRVVYGNWHWYHYPPVHWHRPWHYSYHYGPFSWHTGIYLRSHFWFTAFHWHKRHIVISRPHVHHYRSRHKIVTSHHAKRWHHKPIHRRGAVYRNATVAKKYARSHGQYKTVHAKQHSKKLSHERFSKVHNGIAVNKNKQALTSKRHTHTSKYATTKKLAQQSTLKKHNYTDKYQKEVRDSRHHSKSQYKTKTHNQRVHTHKNVNKKFKEEPHQRDTWRKQYTAKSSQSATRTAPKYHKSVSNSKTNKRHVNKSSNRTSASKHTSRKVHSSHRKSHQRQQHK